MIRTAFSFFFIIVSTICYAQEYTWPILGQTTGDCILSQPQQYLDGDLNYEELYISAPLGTEVVAPTSGYIDDLYVTEKITRFYAKYWNIRKGNFDQCIADIISSGEKLSVNTAFLSGNISIRTLEGDYVHIGGLRGAQNLSTGQYILKFPPVSSHA